MQIRKEALVNGQYYHIYSRSIAKYKIFNSSHDFERIIDIIRLYRYSEFNLRYSKLIIASKNDQVSIRNAFDDSSPKAVSIVAYCIMPTHIHLLMKQHVDKGISKFMSKILNSYTRYFNVKTSRTGPLWAGRFKSVNVSNDAQLLHLTRYIHLNPVSAGIVENPEDWASSSYNEYIGVPEHGICDFNKILNINKKQYSKFVNERKTYQRDLSLIKSYLIDDYAG